MIEKKLIPVGGLKREPFSGSHSGMRYIFRVDESKETFTVTVYPEPWSFEKTPEEKKEHESFPMSDEGMDSAIEWLYHMYDQKKELWQESSKNAMHIVHKGTV